jgi:hypothetical protein
MIILENKKGNSYAEIKPLSWFQSNPTLVLELGRIVYLSEANTYYKIGDGVTQLSDLNWNKTVSVKKGNLTDMSYKYGYNVNSMIRTPIVGSRANSIDWSSDLNVYLTPFEVTTLISATALAFRVSSIVSGPHSVLLALYKYYVNNINSRYVTFEIISDVLSFSVNSSGLYSQSFSSPILLTPGNYAVGWLSGVSNRANVFRPIVGISGSSLYYFYTHNNESLSAVFSDTTLSSTYSYDLQNPATTNRAPMVNIRYNEVL